MTQSLATIEKDRYWATEPPEAMGGLMVEQFRRYFEGLDSRGITGTWRRMLRLYYGRDAQGGYASSHAIGYGGEQGETIAMRSNQMRSLGRRYLVIATADRPAFEVSANNDAANTQAQVQLGRQLLESALDDGGLEEQVYNASEMTLPMAEAYVYQWWDVEKGEPVAVEQVPEVDGDGQPVLDEAGQPKASQKPVMSGDIVEEAFAASDVARDLNAPPRSDPQWYIVRRWYKRWDLIARFPDKGEELRRLVLPKDVTRGVWTNPTHERSSPDWVPVLTLYHASTPALPGGRMIECVGEVWLTDGPLPYGELPLHRIRPATEMDSDTGYSDFWDLIATQEAYDAVMSSLVSCHDIAGMPNLLASEGQEVTPKMLEGGGRILYWKADGRNVPPAWLPPPPISEGHLKLREALKQDLEENSGINSVARGNANENSKSGASQALLASMAQQFANGFVRAVAGLYRSLAKGRLELWKRFATTERTIEVVGSDEERQVKSFKGSDIASLRSVKVDLAPALLRTIPGKMEIADKMLEAYGPEVIPPVKYMQLLATGRLDPVWKGPMDAIRTIAEENEALSKGEQVVALKIENHYRHIMEHSCVGEAALLHIGEHATLYSKLMFEEPELFAMTQEALPKATLEMLQAIGVPIGMPPGGVDPMTGQPIDPANGPPMPDAANEGPPGAPAPKAQTPGAGPIPGGPRMPRNPATGANTAPNGRPVE